MKELQNALLTVVYFPRINAIWRLNHNDIFTDCIDHNNRYDIVYELISKMVSAPNDPDACDYCGVDRIYNSVYAMIHELFSTPFMPRLVFNGPDRNKIGFNACCKKRLLDNIPKSASGLTKNINQQIYKFCRIVPSFVEKLNELKESYEPKNNNEIVYLIDIPNLNVEQITIPGNFDRISCRFVITPNTKELIQNKLRVSIVTFRINRDCYFGLQRVAFENKIVDNLCVTYGGQIASEFLRKKALQF